MYFKKLPYSYLKAVLPSTAANDDRHPIGLSAEKFADLFNNVRSLNFSAYSLPLDPLKGLNLVASSMVEALQRISEMGEQEMPSVISGQISRRLVVPAGKLTNEGLILPPSQQPSMTVDYPTHQAGDSAGSLIIDFGKVIHTADLFFPEIIIEFSNGMSSTTGGAILGAVQFEDYGQIQIYGGPHFFGAVGGDIKIEERFDSLGLTPAEVSKKGGIITVMPMEEKKFNGFRTLDSIFLNETKCSFTLSGTGTQTLQVTIPPNARTGPLLFIQKSPKYDAFYSPVDVMVRDI